MRGRRYDGVTRADEVEDVGTDRGLAATGFDEAGWKAAAHLRGRGCSGGGNCDGGNSGGCGCGCDNGAAGCADGGASFVGRSRSEGRRAVDDSARARPPLSSRLAGRD